jgi:hypothetical protein
MEDCLPSRSSLASANLTAIVATDLDMRTLTRLDSICREMDVPLVAVGLTGSAGFVFNDFNSNFEVTDADGEDPKEVNAASLAPLYSELTSGSVSCVFRYRSLLPW